LPSRAVEFDLNTLPSGTPEELAGPFEAPVKPGQRLPTLDILRGVALLGVLILNIEIFAGLEGLFDIPVGLARPAFVGWHAHLDWTIVIVKWLFAEGRMRGMFSMLFGAGVILLTERIEQRAGPGKAASIYYRRNLWLLLFGLIHGFVLWYGDILVYYSVMALLFLYPLRRLRARTLIVLGLAVWLFTGTATRNHAAHVVEILHEDAQLTAAKAAGQNASPTQQALLAASRKAQQAQAATLKDNIRKEQLGFLDGWPDRIEAERSWLFWRYFSSFRFVEILGAMITGMGLYKAGFLTNRRGVREYVIVAIAGYAVALPLTLTGLWHLAHAGFTVAAYARWMRIPYTPEYCAGALANTSLLLLLIRSGRLKAVFRPLAAVGRTAFSNYILTTIICKTIFSWGPWKLFGQLEFYQWYLVVAGVWTFNLVFSSIWLRFFAFGPLEWTWRSLTYWKRQRCYSRSTLFNLGLIFQFQRQFGQWMSTTTRQAMGHQEC
jgi:uncharacterized protein